eukprot:5300245-Amphidinium_carterae.1
MPKTCNAYSTDWAHCKIQRTKAEQHSMTLWPVTPFVTLGASHAQSHLCRAGCEEVAIGLPELEGPGPGIERRPCSSASAIADDHN